MKKTAVVLFNLGGPDSRNAIRPFLTNFFMDKNIIRVPIPLRCLIAWAIARKRTRRQAGDSYALLGNKSPLLENSQMQADALEKVLNGSNDGKIYKTFVCMRYWHPMASEIVRAVRAWGADEIVLLPLYPQFSTTTTWSSLGAWRKAAFEAGYETPESLVCCYPFDEGFIHASADLVRGEYERALQEMGQETGRAPRVLFSAHGLPESVVKDGDPYQWQCEEGARRIVAALDIPGLDWAVCYQSRVGPQKWIGPSTEDELSRAAADKKSVVIYPHAFTQEHVETLVEIELEYRHLAEEKGVPGFYRVPTVSTHPAFIEGLARLVRERPQDTVCPVEWRRCCRRYNSQEKQAA